MNVTKHLFTLMALVSIAGFGQAVEPAVPELGPPEVKYETNSPAPLVDPGFPAAGDYSIIVNAYISAYARVVVYDNWIKFSATNMNPTTGTWQTPSRQVANGNTNGLYTVDGVALHDLAGGAVETNCRLNISIDMGGHLTRVSDDGTAFEGNDTRKADNGPYQLATMYKINFHGRFLDDDPADDADGTPYPSPTSALDTEYNTWTGWDSAGNSGDASLTTNDVGWLWPDLLFNAFAWTGDAAGYAALTNSTFDPSSFTQLQFMDLVIERGQAQKDAQQGTETNYPDSNRSEWWIAESVMRRGLQDVAGNYRQDIVVLLSYRETPAVWAP